MIKAMIFDLDGTLVQTERLKAISYAKAAIELCPDELAEEQVIEAFKEVVGRGRREVAERMIDRFGLEPKARARMEEFGVSAPWQTLLQIRLAHYEAMLADPEVIRRNQWPHNLAVLRAAREAACRTGLATMSRCSQVTRVLQILELVGAFDFVATRDDVERGKPDPEIYLLVSQQLQVPPSECLVLEDSASGVAAAVAADMWCIAVTTPFTRESVHAQRLLDRRWIVDQSEQVMPVVQAMLEERGLD